MLILTVCAGSDVRNVIHPSMSIACLARTNPLARLFALSFQKIINFQLKFHYVSLVFLTIQFLLSVMGRGGVKTKTTARLKGQAPYLNPNRGKAGAAGGGAGGGDDGDEDKKRKRGASHKNTKLNLWPQDNLLPALQEYNQYDSFKVLLLTQFNYTGFAVAQDSLYLILYFQIMQDLRCG